MIIGTNPWFVHRNTEVFGDVVESFRPERWLKTDDRANMGAASFCFVLPTLTDTGFIQRDSSSRLVKAHASVSVEVRIMTSFCRSSTYVDQHCPIFQLSNLRNSPFFSLQFSQIGWLAESRRCRDDRLTEMQI